MKLLLAAGVVLALVAGGWALFLRSDQNHGNHLTIGALEDGVKWSDPKLADEKVAFATRANFNAHDITTAEIKAYIVKRQEEGAQNGTIVLRDAARRLEAMITPSTVTVSATFPLCYNQPRKLFPVFL